MRIQRIDHTNRGRPAKEQIVHGDRGIIQILKRFTRFWNGFLNTILNNPTWSVRAVDLARQAHQQETSALYESSAAVPVAFFGNAGEARRWAMAALELSKSRDAEYGAASALAVAGDASSSQARGRFGTALPGG